MKSFSRIATGVLVAVVAAAPFAPAPAAARPRLVRDQAMAADTDTPAYFVAYYTDPAVLDVAPLTAPGFFPYRLVRTGLTFVGVYDPVAGEIADFAQIGFTPRLRADDEAEAAMDPETGTKPAA